ncbi:MAG: hypothetical protein WB341_11615 [Terracidiphilus sp.]
MVVCVSALAGWGGSMQGADPKPGSLAQLPAADPKLVPPTPIAIQRAELDEPTWDPAWNQMIEKALPEDLLSWRRAREVRPLCPRYRGLSKTERRAFWAYFFQALAGAEAGLKPTADVHHADPKVDVTDIVSHRPVRQEGLLQLTYMDSLRYGCKFDWAKDKVLPEHDLAKTILQPENNLLCGVKIVEHQLVKRREPLLSNQSYWSTLRPDNPSFAVFIRQMANVPAYCEVRPRLRKPMKSSSRSMVKATDQPPKTNQGADTANSQ